MKKIVCIVFILFAATPMFAQKNYTKEWKQIDSLLRLQQPQSAEKMIDKIYKEALIQNNAAQLVKAHLYKTYSQDLWSEEGLLQSIRETEQAIANTAVPAKNILHSIAADFYWRYYNQNRWRFHSRSISEIVSDDISTWDLSRIVAKCSEHYSASLAAPADLQKTAIEPLSAILLKAENSEKYRPTLYDFLAFRALEFYANNVPDLLQPAERFAVADPQYFALPEKFTAVKISTVDTLSFKFQALTLFQQIIAFHLKDANPTALIDADLQRLDFVYANTLLPEKDTLYLAALQALDSRYTNNPASTEILFRIARLYSQQGDLYDPFSHTAVQGKKRDALETVNKALARFPKSFGAKNCAALKDQIEQPKLSLTAEAAALPNKPLLLSLQYKNTPMVEYRIIPVDFKQMLETQRNTPADNIEFYTKRQPVHTGRWTLPDDKDYQTHHIEVTLPALKEGYYMILASADGNFTKNSSALTENGIWITNISYIQQMNRGSATLMLLHRETGKPLSNIQTQTYVQEYDYSKRRYVVKFGDTLRSDAQGMIYLQKTKDFRNENLYFTNGKDQYASGESFYLYDPGEDASTHVSTTFFTDRAIYRPGQTVWFKGLVLQWDQNKAKVVEKQSQTISLYNVNHEKIADLRVTTNEFGSFAGNFTLPSAGLTGQMSIEGENGNIYFQVEEYKRPKFEVTFEPVETSYRLGDQVTVTGRAKTYAGSVVSDASVTYRITRQLNYPYRGRSFGPVPSGSEDIVGYDTITTNPDGSFTISFKAAPDPYASLKDKPEYCFVIHASVSDINGETHEAQSSVLVGNQSLFVSADIPTYTNTTNWKAIKIEATNMAGTPQFIKGKLAIWKLKEPNRILQSRLWQRPDKFSMTRDAFEKLFPDRVYDQEDQVETWPREQQVYSLLFDTKDSASYAIDATTWSTGKYVAQIQTQDASGTPIEQTLFFSCFSEKQDAIPADEAIWFQVLTPEATPGDTVKIGMGSALKTGQAFYEIVSGSGTPQRKVLSLNGKQNLIEIVVQEPYRGDFSVNFFFVYNNRAYSASQVIRVPYNNKQLQLEFASFRDKLQPGQEEEWRITMKDHTGNAVAAELLASMYDASLDAFRSSNWHFFPWYDHGGFSQWSSHAAFLCKPSQILASLSPRSSYSQRHYSQLLSPNIARSRAATAGGVRAYTMANDDLADNESVLILQEAPVAKRQAAATVVQEETLLQTEESQDSGPAAAEPQIRSNFNETAFFYPQLRTNEKGEILISFTVPEALTRWKMRGLAWTQDLKVGSIAKELLTQKDLMIFSNTPRFFRENDTIYFSAKISNISDKTLHVKTEVQFFDALNMQPISDKLLLENALKNTLLVANDNKALSWKIHIPEGLQAITYRITATCDSFSDGEESTLPVLSNRMLVTESLPLPIRGNQTKSYEFTKLLHNQSQTLANYAYTLEFTSNPAWNAVMALPYIMEYPYECVEQTFSRYYANAIASHIVNSDPKIKQVFEIWRNYQPDALQSKLEKNEDLKALLLEESPWVRAAQNEKERKQRIAILFDLNRMSGESAVALQKIAQAQSSNGGFCWFKGGPDDRYMTQHIVAGFGHLNKMKVPSKVPEEMLQKAIGYLDARLTEDLNALKKQAEKSKKDYQKEDHLGSLAIHYLYARSFFTEAYPIPKAAKEAFDFYKTQAATYWNKQNNYMKGMLALALHRYGNPTAARLIMKSLSETALHSEEMGMYWKNAANSWWWYQAPIETQSLLIEAFNEILNDQKSVEDMKVWLLKQKQTTDWKTTKATSEAIYALLLTGSHLLANDALCEITVGGQTIDPNRLEGDNRPEAGTGYFKTSWRGNEITPDMGKITVKNPNPTVAWGAAYWQYFEQLDKISSAGTGVNINKQLFLKTNSPNGPVLKEIKPGAPMKTGDKITVRIEIRSDRDMEYVHLKDMRASAFEPVNVLSRYKWQDGLGYYESTRDAATHFFISYLPKGTYVFEYDLFATQQGEFSNGITTLQCMYAPEFTTHSAGIRIQVQ